MVAGINQSAVRYSRPEENLGTVGNAWEATQQESLLEEPNILHALSFRTQMM
jgi:hypothetical protein